MNKEQFTSKLLDNFEIKELSLINTNIYFNKTHIDYYMKYHECDYEWCYDYLIDNRHLLKQ